MITSEISAIERQLLSAYDCGILHESRRWMLVSQRGRGLLGLDTVRESPRT